MGKLFRQRFAEIAARKAGGGTLDGGGTSGAPALPSAPAAPAAALNVAQSWDSRRRPASSISI